MEVDAIGSKDYMAIVVTKQPLDYKAYNDKVNQQSGSFEQKLRTALGAQLINNVQFLTGETMKFNIDAGNNGAVLMVIEVDKN